MPCKLDRFDIKRIETDANSAFLILGVPGGYAAWNLGADFVQLLAPALAPEQGAGPDTVNRTIKLRLLARPTVPVSTEISPKSKRNIGGH